MYKRQGFSVTVYDKNERAGGSLLKANLPQEAINEDLKQFQDEDVTFRFNEYVDDLDALSNYDAVLLATGSSREDSDSVTMITSVDGIFSGGDFPSLIEALAAGKRVSNTINRYRCV